MKNNYILKLFILVIFIYHCQWLMAVSVSDKFDSFRSNMDDIIVSATRTERQFYSIPLPAQIIQQDQIKQVNSNRLTDILNEQTGLVTVPSFGGGEGIQIQGLNSEYILILIDGVPLIGRHAGTLDLSRVSVGNIKRIEIVKGASSCLYGNEALGGVVNIITEKPKKGIESNIRYRVSSFNTHDVFGKVNYKKNNMGAELFLNRNSSNGYDLVDDDNTNTVEPYENYTASTKMTYDITKKISATLTGRYFHQNQTYRPTEENIGKSKINDWNGLLNVDQKINLKWLSHFELYFSQYQSKEFARDENEALAFENSFKQSFLRPEYRIHFNSLNEKHNIMLGAGMTYETVNRANFIENPTFYAPYLYVQYDAYPTKKLNAIAGFRYDHHSNYQPQLSPKVAFRYELYKTLAIKGSVGLGYKAPDFRQLYFNFNNSSSGYTVLGYNAVPIILPELENKGEIANIDVPLAEMNDNLKPESSISYNLSLDYTPATNFNVSLNFFRNDIYNLINTRAVARKTNGQNVFSYYNVNRAFTQGLELNAKYAIMRNLTISGGYQLLYAKDKDAIREFENNKVFARLPSGQTIRLSINDYFGLANRSRHMGNIKVFYNIPKWKMNANIRVIYRSKYGINDGSNGNAYLDNYDQFVDGYTLMNIAINKTLYDNYQVGIGVDNLLDFTNPEQISNIPGRIIYGKLSIKL